MTNLRTKLAAVVGATGLTVGLLAVGAAPAVASQGASQVTICHATASQSNPYVRETVDISSSGFDKGYLKAGHAQHTGPVWYPGLVGKWGDIIPSYDYVNGTFQFHFDGLNWDATGQATYDNDCNFPGPNNPSSSSPVQLGITTEVHAGSADSGAPVVVDDAHPALAGSDVHDSAQLTWTGGGLPEGSTVTFYFWSSHDCSGDAAGHSSAMAAAASVDPGLAEAGLAAGTYSFQAVFTSGDPESVANASSDCEPFAVISAAVSSPSQPSPSASFSSTQAGATAMPSEPNTATLGGAGTSGQSNGSWLLVAALGVLLSSVAVLTPARVKRRR